MQADHLSSLFPALPDNVESNLAAYYASDRSSDHPASSDVTQSTGVEPSSSSSRASLGGLLELDGTGRPSHWHCLPKSGLTPRLTSRTPACYNYRAALISYRSCLKPVDTFRDEKGPRCRPLGFSGAAHMSRPEFTFRLCSGLGGEETATASIAVANILSTLCGRGEKTTKFMN